MQQNKLKLLSLTKEAAQIFKKQEISDNAPGSILKDFSTMLDFIGEKGIETAGKYDLFSMKILTEINSQLTHPVNLNLKRPQQKSFPHVNGIYLILRSTGIMFPKKIGKKRVLILNEKVLQSWHDLNSTEKYFTLLEAWLLQGNEEIIQEHNYRFPEHLSKCNYFFSQKFNDKGILKSNQKRDEFAYTPEWYNLALLQMFGLITIKTVPNKVGKLWLIEQVQTTDFGNIIISWLDSIFEQDIFRWEIPEAKDLSFGKLQKVLQPFFPEFKNSLLDVNNEFQEGSHIFKVVVLGKIWRRIAISGRYSLDLLSDIILEAFDFDHAHLYRFKYRNSKGVTINVNAQFVEIPPFTTDILIGSLALNQGDQIDYIYDFGDNWEFTVILEKVESENGVISQPKILEYHGEAPEQYDDIDDIYEY
ncbi:plasmid pRiA4b ORF-3 family protein [Candidatus Halobeggiatoa sp. HSG11]|nr:plasmid pRiA4b ORF-3 family protein [Candidatus Halobeggiatoa sp. HSG11]